MLDFLMIATRSGKRGIVEVYPKFIVGKSADLMIRGGDFYAVWMEDKGLWSTDEQDVIRMVDQELDKAAKELRDKIEEKIKVLHMWDSESRMINLWHTYCQKDMRDSFHNLDEKLIFSNTETSKKDYASKKLNYPLEKGPIDSYEKLIGTLYIPEERQKIEWSIGSIVSGESKKIQKFVVLYGAGGTGKSTIIDIIEMLFDGYYTVFDAKALGSSNSSFALEPFKSNPLVAIQHDGDLSHIEDNTRLNSLVSHEMMTINEKFKSLYSNRFKCFLFMGTNKPVKITDAKSGLIRRLIDISPSGNLLPRKEYDEVKEKIKFELGAIANHCLEVYKENPHLYDDYIPLSMFGASNDFFNFVLDSYCTFEKENETTLNASWEMYKTYCDDAKVPYPLTKRAFKEELKNYFEDFKERVNNDEGTRLRNYYKGFKTDIFDEHIIKISNKPKEEKKLETWLKFENFSLSKKKSNLDILLKECPAQYASSIENGEIPSQIWDNVTTTLGDIDSTKLHYVRPPLNHIVIDFDIPDENGNKCLEKNIEEASKFPPTYAELSKSGNGIHLHYIYNGDPTQLSRLYKDKIEIKVFTGKSSLRRKLSKCNDISIANISSGLPLKGEKKMVNFEGLKNEKALRNLIVKNLKKEIHPNTKPSVIFIYDILEEAYKSNMKYDVTDMANDILNFAAQSTNNSKYCLKLVNQMHFKSDDISENKELPNKENEPICFFDCEVFINLFIICYKFQGENKPTIRLINPNAKEIEELLSYKLVGFNNRRYDNHILYARLIGYSNEELFNLSQRIVKQDRNAFFGEAYNLSYSDIYDFASAGNKKGLKKFEIDLKLPHKESRFKWDKPVPEEYWIEVSDYCVNDVLATEAVFNHLNGDWMARKILADLAGMTVNDTTNSLTARIIFGKEKHPQSEFHYRNLAEPVYNLDEESIEFLEDLFPEMMAQKHGEAESLLPYFPGYTYERGVSTYKKIKVGEGGCVIAQPGMYVNVALLDIVSMHPHSALAEVLFGPKFTKRFKEIVYGRVTIKHKAWDEVDKMLGGALKPYIQQVIDGIISSDDLANALKTAINAVYGLTAAGFDNPFRDRRNVDNIVAKRGALSMIDLKEAVEEKGFTVAHIKTDSIKIPNATPEIIQFVIDFGKQYGYTFEHEATYERMCLVNDAVYIAKYNDQGIINKGGKHANEWTATGKQFAVPYVFKSLFTKEKIEFEDLCETKSVTTAMYLRPEGSTDPYELEFVGKVGSFCPIKKEQGGKELVCERNDKNGDVKYDSVTGAKDYLWLESDTVKEKGFQNNIDMGYFFHLCEEAIDAISQYGDFEWFSSDDKEFKSRYMVPPWNMECGRDSCLTCPNFFHDQFHMECEKGFDISESMVDTRDYDGDNFNKR